MGWAILKDFTNDFGIVLSRFFEAYVRKSVECIPSILLKTRILKVWVVVSDIAFGTQDACTSIVAR